MYLIVYLAIIGTFCGVPLSLTIKDGSEKLRENYVLPKVTFPTFYDVRLFLNPNKIRFFGNVTIRILANSETDVIILHAMDLEIENIKVHSASDTNTDLFEDHSLADDDTHFLMIQVKEFLKPLLPYTIHINYIGKFAKDMFGIFVFTHTFAKIITSRLEPIFARRAFPCYDEPAYKAAFRTTIYAPSEYPVVRSNTDIRKVLLKNHVPGWYKHEFEDTLVMSTYQQIYFIATFKYEDNSENPIYHIPFRVYSRSYTQNFTNFALDFGQKNMMALENYTQFDYKFSKMDTVAVPGFVSRATGGWGLVIYRESNLLYDDRVTPATVKQKIARLICHENAHQWFGSEVSPLSWNYTWLSEGFANFFEYFATDLVFPNWKMMDQFVIAQQNIYQTDAEFSAPPISYEVFTSSQILESFNAAAYQKCGAVIRMMQHFLTSEIFRNGVLLYIKNNSRRVVSPNDLYTALQQALDESDHTTPWPISTILNGWTTQAGFPVITVRHTEQHANSLYVSQRYFTDTSLFSTDRWYIPINWVLSTGKNNEFEDTSPLTWIGDDLWTPMLNIPGLADADWFVFNKQQTGFYRVNYDIENWKALARVLNSDHRKIHVLNRAQILNDVFEFAKTGRLGYVYALEISLYLSKEDDYIPWAAMNPAFGFLDLALHGFPTYKLYKQYRLALSAPLFTKLGFISDPGEEHVMSYHRQIILDVNCRFGNLNCINEAQKLLQDIQKNTARDLSPDVEAAVYCCSLHGGDEESFSYVWRQYQNCFDSGERIFYLHALGCTTNPDMRSIFLNEVINDEAIVSEQDRHIIIVSVMDSSPENMDAALDFVLQHWPTIQSRANTTSILSSFSKKLTNKEHLEKMVLFVKRHQTTLTFEEMELIAAIRKNIDTYITWSDENAGAVGSWLRDNYSSAASSITAGLLSSVLLVWLCYLFQ